jgi:hypothetical protein
MIFSKTFLPKKLRADNTKLMQKQIEEKLDTSEVVAEKQFLTNPLGKRRHVEPKWKNFFHNFSTLSTQTKYKRNFEKKFIRIKVTVDWKLEAILNFRRHFESDKKLFSMIYAVYDH